MIVMFIATTTIVIWPLWALMNGATSSPVFGPVFLFKGLFVQCLQYMPGQYQCDNYLRPVFTLTSFEILTRCFGILSCILDGMCLLLMLIGMECSKVLLANHPNIKVKIMKLVVFLLFNSSIMLLVTAILFTLQIRSDFNANRLVTNIFGSQERPNVDKIRYEYGGCIYAAFCISGIQILMCPIIWYCRGFRQERSGMWIQKNISFIIKLLMNITIESTSQKPRKET